MKTLDNQAQRDKCKQLKEVQMKLLLNKMQHKLTLNQVVRHNNKIMTQIKMQIWMELAMVPVEQVMEMLVLVPVDHPLHEMFDLIF